MLPAGVNGVELQDVDDVSNFQVRTKKPRIKRGYLGEYGFGVQKMPAVPCV